MNSELRLFIENREVDLSTDPNVAMTYQLEDTTNPTVTKVGYSKTITVEGSQKNNQIFGDIWDLRRTQDYNIGGFLNGVYFDPSKRATAQIFANGDLVEDGYVKLDSIKRNGEQIQYNLTFYGGLADFFYTLSYDDEGEQRTLASLDYGQDLGFEITKEVVRDAWAEISGNHPTEWVPKEKWRKINFAPCYNGLPENFSPDKAIINFNNNNTFKVKSKTEGGITYKDYNNTGFALGELNRDYTEWEMRDLRSYLQRPVLSVSAFWDAIKREAEKNGYILDLDKGFFNDINPYYKDTWMTLPMLNSLDDADGISYSTVFKKEDYGILGNDDQFFIGWNATDKLHQDFTYYLDVNAVDSEGRRILDNGYVSVSVPFKFNMAIQNNKGYPAYLSYRDSTSFFGNAKDRFSSFLIQLVAYDRNGNVIGGSDIHNFTTQLFETSKSYRDYGYTPAYSASEAMHYGYFAYNKEEKTNYFTSDTQNVFNLVIDNLVPSDYVAFAVHLAYRTYNWDDNKHKNQFPYTTLYVDNSQPWLTASTTIKTEESGSNFEYTVYGTINSGTYVPQKKLLATTNSPCDIMLSFTKLFGLYWVKDLGERVIHIYTRSRFFTGETVDLTSLVDGSKEQTITPITFDAKYYNMELEMEETLFSQKYFKDYSRQYGTQKINTNYNFDSEINQLYDGNVFKGAVTALGKSNYYRHFKTPDWTEQNQHYYPAPVYDGVSYQLFKDGQNIEETTDIEVNMVSCRYINWSGRPRYDCVPKVCFYDEDNGAVSGENVLLFYRGNADYTDANGNPITFYLTDDVTAMYTLNDNSACWFITDSSEDAKGNVIAIPYTNLPVFSRYQGDNNIAYSLDFGEPQELYVNYSNSEASTIYHKYWKNFLSDQLDVDTRIMETFILWDEKIDESWLRKFYFFENSYWILNKVTDYVLGSFATTKCEFIKVQNLGNYTDGQVLSYAESYLFFDTDSITVNAGGITGFEVGYTETNMDDLRVSSDVSWIQVTVNKEENKVIIYVDANLSANERTGNVIISGLNAGGLPISDSLVVTQAVNASTGLTVAPNSAELDWFNAADTTVDVTTESNYTITTKDL